jgi:channel protein (hemolysin III family)
VVGCDRLGLMYLSRLMSSFFMLPYAKDILQIFDHVSIYLVIAGSYTPFMMIALHHNTSANVLLVVEWLTAFVGICISIATSGIGCSQQATNFMEVRSPCKATHSD